MKIVSLLMLSLFLVSCGGGGGESKTKTYRRDLDGLNDQLKEQGLKVAKGYIPGSISEHVIIACIDADTTKADTNNYDRAKSLETYRDNMKGMEFVEFGDGSRTEVWRVEWALNEAIGKLENDLSGRNCPEVYLGKTKIL